MKRYKMARKQIDLYDKDQEQICLDIETLSLNHNAVIVSIGGCRFTVGEGIMDKFSVNIDPFDSKKLGLHIDPDTIAWWKKQPKEVSDLWKVNQVSLEYAMERFVEWYGLSSVPTWTKGIDFDLVILKHSLKAVNLSTPWKYWDACDVRTAFKMAGFEKDLSKIMHSAVDDAVDQAKDIISILGEV